METKDINIAAGKTMPLQAHGSGFRFESGTSTTIDKYIKVTPENGPAVLIKPGQQFQVSHPVGNWTLACNDAGAVIAGRVVIFDKGENFADSNVNSTFTLDATLANNVTVMNTGANPVPVSFAGGELEIKNDAGNPINTADIMAYTNSVYTNLPATSYTAMVSAAANINGVIIEQVIVDSATVVKLLAKATQPVSAFDGDVLSTPLTLDAYKTRQKIPAGRGVWAYNSAGGAVQCVMLYTVL